MPDLEAFLQVLSGMGAAGPLVEVRYRGERGMRQAFCDVLELPRAAAMIRRLAPGRDVYVGALTRERASGGRDAVSLAHLVWVEVDAAAADTLLLRAPAPPSMVVASGSAGHLHAYWRLRHLVTPDRAEAANRRLAHRVGADLACVDAARILRPPETFNHKHDPPRPVRLLELDHTRVYDLPDLVRGLEDPALMPEGQRTRGVSGHRSRFSPRRPDAVYEQLREIPAANYVQRLAGRHPDREGKVLCPFHEEDTPSLQVYEDGHFFCFGCRRGGSIVDFAAQLWDLGTKGRDFYRVRDRLAEELLAIPVHRSHTREVSA